jgi:uncharacterized protein YdaT
MTKVIDTGYREAKEWYKNLEAAERNKLFSVSKSLSEIADVLDSDKCSSASNLLQEVPNLDAFKSNEGPRAATQEPSDEESVDAEVKDDQTEPLPETQPLILKSMAQKDKIRSPFAGKNIQFSSKVFTQRSIVSRSGKSVFGKQNTLPPLPTNSCVEETTTLLKNI